MIKKNVNLTIVWITRVSDVEDEMIKNFFEKHDLDYEYEKIIVGHTYLDQRIYNFKYIPFWENGLDEQGLICTKKNLGVSNSTKEYCLVLHADTFPTKSLFERVGEISLTDKDVVAPIGYILNQPKDYKNRGITWANNSISSRHKHLNECDSDISYISGAAIFSKTSTFKTIGWNNSLRHDQAEDFEYSDRLRKNKYILSCDPKLEVYMHNTQ